MLKKLFSTIVLALVLASGLALASCASSGKEGIPLDNGADCIKRGFPQCGLDGAH
jgi:hypothetical protein